ncbi:NAD(P)-binding protein [Atractiella rhizophila]|nr:NAD(P)-binding protein [Atractiella rhizophila]
MSTKILVITGTSRGIGLELVKQLSAMSSNLTFALVRNPSKAVELATLASQRKNLVIVQADTSVTAEITKAVQQVEKELAARGLKGVDVLINNAGIGGPRDVWTNVISKATSWEPVDFLELFRVNVVGVVETTKGFLSLLHAGNDKKILMASSTVGLISPVGTDKDILGPGNPGGSAPYAMSKAGLNMVSRKLATEQLKPEGFTVILVHPGWVKTDMGGEQAMLTTEESVIGLVKRIEEIKPEESGNFWAPGEKWEGF